MNFVITLISVATMLAYAIPGYLLVKGKLVKEEATVPFANLLLYVCQPCLTIYLFNDADYTPLLGKEMLLFFVLSLVLLLAIMISFYYIFRNKLSDIRYRICVTATCLSNSAFFGIPILEALLPQYPEAVIFSMIFSVNLNIVGWTLAFTIITGDKKFISAKNIFLNPTTVSLFISLPLFLLQIKIPQQIDSILTMLGQMCTPLCMMVLGMRLATMKWKPIFTSPLQYFTVFVNQMLMPLLGMLLFWFLPIETYLKQTVYILCCCPVASIILNFSEMEGKGKETAANVLLLGSLSSIITVPVMMLLI